MAKPTGIPATGAPGDYSLHQPPSPEGGGLLVGWPSEPVASLEAGWLPGHLRSVFVCAQGSGASGKNKVAKSRAVDVAKLAGFPAPRAPGDWSL